MTPASSVEHEAADWLVRIRDPGFEAWSAWEAWLARDPRNAEVYWRMAEQDAALVDPSTTSAIAPPLAPAPRRRPTPVRGPAAPRRRIAARPGLWIGGAVAASIAVAVLVFAVLPSRSGAVFETRPGSPQSFTLADGSRAHLAGATRMRVTDARHVELEAGRAVFDVVHDAAEPFRVRVGEDTLTDLGTVFDVTRLETGLRLAVAEGVVRYDGAGGSETVRAGESLLTEDTALRRDAVDAASVDGWRRGRLSYRSERLTVVAGDLALVLGRPVSVDPALASRRFTGVLAADGPEADVRARAETVLGVRIRTVGNAWRIGPAEAP